MKIFEELSLAALGHFLQSKGTRLDQPFLFSFDCDQTLVDRTRGPHFTSQEVINMFTKLCGDSQYRIAINTGRDAASYAPVGRLLQHDGPCLFVSGRVLRLDGACSALPHAALSKATKEHLWQLFADGVCPFLDVKTTQGYGYYTAQGRNTTDYLGHHRPPSWFDEVEKKVIALDRPDRATGKYFDEEIVRIDAPFWRDRHPHICEAIESRDLSSVEEELEALLQISPRDMLMLLPAPTAAGNARKMRAVASVRIMKANSQVNKGTGLRALAKLLGIRQQNILSFGDSSGPVASDRLVKEVLPHSLLFITEDGDARAKGDADFIIGSASKDGVPKAVARLLRMKGSVG